MIIGTTNAGKLREIAAICMPLGVELEVRSFDIPETGETFESNALIKALAYSERCPGEFVLVEDSGLVVPALGGLPGPWSARFAAFDADKKTVDESYFVGLLPQAIDETNCAAVLRSMKDIPFERRGAHFVICLNVVLNHQLVFTTTCTGKHGWIAQGPRGTNGFGYDPIFIGQDTFGKTYAEIDAHRKNLRSHRNEALEQFELWLSEQVRQGIKL